MRKEKASERQSVTPVTPENQSVLRALGIVGYDAIEPVIIAAMATEFPLLLIGPHGTAKSLLLNSLAQALHLTHRHYNAAMINFDDLVGFPFPNEQKTGLDYIPTRGSIWGVQSVFIDEISRTRIDMQNRLFPLIHEKVIQGISLDVLRFRWAAMNPPHNTDEDEDTSLWNYAGSEALDIALADRFPFIVFLPSFSNFSERDKLAVIGNKQDVCFTHAGALLRQRIHATNHARERVLQNIGENIAHYVHALQPLLEKIKCPISPRRAGMIHDAIAAVIAAELATGNIDAKPAAFLALSNALPHPAYGQSIDMVELLAVHSQAWKLAEIPPTDPRRVVFAESDPVRRVALGLAVNLSDIDLSTLVQDAYAGLNAYERICFAAALYPIVSTSRNLTAVAFETLAEEWTAIQNTSVRHHQVTSGSSRHRQWQRIARWISEQDTASMGARTKINIALVLFEREAEFETKDVERAFGTFSALFPWH